jgi:superfamily II DNA or RNA helicase
MILRKVLVPGRVIFCPIDFPGMKSLKFSQAYREGIVDAPIRNQMIAYLAGEMVRGGRKVLILVHHLPHGEQLQQMIAGSRFVQSADGPEVRKAVAQLDAGEIRCLIGSPVVGEGLDCPAADCLIYAKGYKAKVTHTQDVFRVMTAVDGKSDAMIIDFADRHNKTLLAHSVERMKNYLGMGLACSVDPNLELDAAQGSLY